MKKIVTKTFTEKAGGKKLSNTYSTEIRRDRIMRVKKRREQEKLQKVKGRRPFVREMRKNWPYYLMMAPSAVLLFL